MQHHAPNATPRDRILRHIPLALCAPLLLVACSTASAPGQRSQAAAATPAPAAAEVSAEPPAAGPEALGDANGALAAVTTTEAEADAETLQNRALEACQEAQRLLDEHNAPAAIAQLDRAYQIMLDLPDTGDEVYTQAKQDIRLVIADLIGRAYRQGAAPTSAAGKNLASWDLGLPMVNNEFVQYEIKSMTTREREELLAGYQRAGRYRPMILKKLEEAGLPSQLSWLPLVESWFKVSALSRASALGLWQFISSTGLRYGLARDEWADLRLDPERSTDAAIAYLSDLHRLFGDWPKALAAYNCGEGRIMRAQKRSETEFLDFWDLYALLPNETRRYVPRLIAALQIIENPQAFGITLPEPDAPLGDSERVTVTRTLQLAALDKSLGLSEGTLAAYNPELRQKATPPAAYELRVPAGRGADVLAAAATLPVYTPPKPKYLVHSVRSGDTLSTIAERYHTSVSAIMRMNSIRSAHRIWPGQRLRIPTRG